MTTTISGGTGTQVSLNVGSNELNGQAANLASQITAALTGGALVRTNNTNPPTGTGFFVTSAVNQTFVLQAAVTAMALASGGANTVIGGGGRYNAIIADNGNLTFQTNGGSGQVVTGDGNNLLATPTTGGGQYQFVTGNGNDTIFASTGNNTVSAGGGSNLIFTGNASDLIYSNGNDIISGIGGVAGQTDTIIGGGFSTFIYEGAKNFNFVGGTGTVTVFGGTGSETVVAGTGGGVIVGGSAGNNSLVGGAGSIGTTMFGGGNGDTLTVRGSGLSFLIAGAGNETLSGASSTAGNIFVAGPGSTSILGGVGNDVIFTGRGNSTVTGGAGADLIAIINGQAGGNVLLNFAVADNDRVTLQGFAADEVTRAVTAAGGTNVVTLSDNTKITFAGLTSVTTNNFI